MNDNWIDNVLKEQYQFVKVLKISDKSQICVYRHKELAKRLVKRSVEGSGEVFMILRSPFST
ncbi:MAG: hypothetical protein ACI4GX_01890 [Ruminococcus sp.]